MWLSGTRSAPPTAARQKGNLGEALDSSAARGVGPGPALFAPRRGPARARPQVNGPHDHDDQAERVGFNWWSVADGLVVAAVILVFVLGTEWLVGALVRERIARGAQQLLRRRAETTTTE